MNLYEISLQHLTPSERERYGLALIFSIYSATGVVARYEEKDDYKLTVSARKSLTRYFRERKIKFIVLEK